MKKVAVTLLCLFFAEFIHSQNVSDFFKSDGHDISYLGIDFSHAKIIGDFSQFFGAGEKNTGQLKDTYFPAWNRLMLDEREKYDIKGMLRLNNLVYDIDMIMDINSKASVKDLESYSTVQFTEADIKRFIDEYPLQGKKGYGILFLAESLNKSAKEAYFNFIVITMPQKEILINERLRGEPSGIGIRSYWAGAVYKIIKDIKSRYYSI